VGGKTKAYFVVVEATELIDYFDQFALRIGFLLIQSLYEQILVAQSLEDQGFEKFLKDLEDGSLKGKETIIQRAEELGIAAEEEYLLMLMGAVKGFEFSAESVEAVKNAAANVLGRIDGRISRINSKQWAVLVPVDQSPLKEEQLQSIRKTLEDFDKRLRSKINGKDLHFAIVDFPCNIADLKRNIQRGKQTLKVGSMIEEDQKIHTYSELGVFAWMDIQEDEFDLMTKDIKGLLDHDSGEELIETLKVYLACKMNYSLAAKQLYIHINTVRKRMETVSDLLSLDLEDPTTRLKLEMLLRLM